MSDLDTQITEAQTNAKKGLTEPSPPIQSDDHAVFLHLEAMMERAVRIQTKPLQDLIEQANEMVRLQYNHLDRTKRELQTMLSNGASFTALAKIMADHIEDARAKHTEVIGPQAT